MNFKQTGTILIVLLLSARWAITGVQANSDAERDRLSGSIETVRTEMAEFTIKDGKRVEGPRFAVQTISYDERGNRTKLVDFNRDGSVAQTIVYNYDAEGRRCGYEDYTPGLSTPRKHIYVLDQTGNRLEYKIVQPTGSAADEKYLYKYDSKGNRIAEELFHKTSLISRNENAYDEQGRLISQVIYNPDGSVSSRIRNVIGPDGKMMERVRYDGDLITYKVRYTYDSKGRIASVETTGSYVEMDSSAEAHVTGKVVHVYKGNDRIKETVTYNPDGSFRERVVFDYDSRGNWTRKTRKIKGASGKDEPAHVEYRTIIYNHG